MVLLGSTTSVMALKVEPGLAVDSDFHGKNSTGYNPGAIDWNLTARAFVPLVTK
jgi:hypothetical protein